VVVLYLIESRFSNFMLKIQFGVAKLNKYASRESGDTVELVERPTGPGGFTAVLVDGQGSGRSAKSLSNFVAGQCVTLLKQGVRDGVVARAASDLLYNHKNGQVSATLNLLTIDFTTQTLIITRNNPEPAYLCDFSEFESEESEVETGSEIIEPKSSPRILTLDEPSRPLGLYQRTRPVIREFELKPGLIAVAFSDGLSNAGHRYGEKIDLLNILNQRITSPINEAQALADELLELAVMADRRRPQDDMSVVVLTVQAQEIAESEMLPRRMFLEAELIESKGSGL
jgi:hypothetical protein